MTYSKTDANIFAKKLVMWLTATNNSTLSHDTYYSNHVYIAIPICDIIVTKTHGNTKNSLTKLNSTE